ncbi:SLC5/6 family protein [Alicyclobacillus dauci]|uniref:Sodium:solute symporter family protein n=1 Tax=Alicyclobacillus dauci TaxID=1475485 RepID=A0ABY6YYK7_9BACL|nr:hypothetical protein [Alicyclobacillus dauci]WAH35672.1 hypothetical protein NZD86_15500 [Alicyclobacillus dauci]
MAYLVLPHHPGDPSYANLAILNLIQASYHNSFVQAIMYTTVALTCLVPVSVMILSASNMFTVNLLKDWLWPSLTEKHMILTSRLFVFFVTIVALLFGVVYPNYITQLAIEATSGIVQIIPTVVIGLYWRHTSAPALVIGLLAGVATVFLNHLVIHLPGIDGFWGLIVNSALVFLVTFALRKDKAESTIYKTSI